MIRKPVKQLIKHLTANNYQTLNRIELDRQRVLANATYIQNQTGQAVIPVLKANAYGHGLEQMAQMLNQFACPFLAVDGYFEAAQIRDITRHRILVMGYIRPENMHLLDTKRCSFVVQDIAGLQALGALRRPIKIHLELETGMHRLGLSIDELDAYLTALKRYPRLQLEGVMTHLADADNPDSNDFNVQQIQLFDVAVERILAAGFQPRYFHIAQTAGSSKAQSKYANALRLGIGLYGINPLDPQDRQASKLAELKPVLELKSTIIKTYELQPGDQVSYGGTFKASSAMRIGILPLGYYEGLPRQLSNQGFVTYKNQALPILGRICMNHTTIDITTTKLTVGGEVTVISKNNEQPNSIQTASATFDQFSYEWLVRLSSSLRRVIV
jgi:alanine racemase